MVFGEDVECGGGYFFEEWLVGEVVVGDDVLCVVGGDDVVVVVEFVFCDVYVGECEKVEEFVGVGG